MPRGNQARGVPTTAAHAPRACATATRSPAHHNQRAAAPPPHTATRESPHAAKIQQARDRETTTIIKKGECQKACCVEPTGGPFLCDHLSEDSTHLETAWTWSQRWARLGLSWRGAAASRSPGYTCMTETGGSRGRLTPRPARQSHPLRSVSWRRYRLQGWDLETDGRWGAPLATSGSLAPSSSQTSQTHPLCRAGNRCRCPLCRPGPCAARPGSLIPAAQPTPPAHCLVGEWPSQSSAHHVNKLLLQSRQWGAFLGIPRILSATHESRKTQGYIGKWASLMAQW